MKMVFPLKTISTLIIVIYMVQISNAAPPEGFDYTVAADVNYVEGELLVRFTPKSNGIQRSVPERNQILSSLGKGTLEHNFRIIPGLSLVKLPPDMNVAEALIVFNNTEGILHAQPNYILEALATFPDDMRFDELWGMHNTRQTGGTPDADIDAPEAWDIITDSNVIVAVIDTGVDYTHPDLADNMWINEVELSGTPGEDDDDNGYIDDIYGYDFCTCSDYGCTNSSKPRDPDPYDDHGHGTHCSGTIGAVGNNSEGVAGVCWGAKIMALKFLNYAGHGKTSDAIAAIQYGVENGAMVLSNSWSGGGYNEGLELAIEAAGANGVLFVAAAGNDSYNNDYYLAYPASYDCDNIISVMATNHTDQVADYSNYGPTSVDIGAPGGEMYYEGDPGGILSTVVGGEYEFYQGTSMATPHVAGACALVWAVNPQLTHLEVKDSILQGVDKLDSLDGLCVTEGRLNVFSALIEAGRQPGILSKNYEVEPNDPNACVLPDYYLTYTISYGNPVTDPNDPNYIGPLNDVEIIDCLPLEVDFHSADCNGVYDPESNTVTWDIGTLEPGDANSVTVTVKVNKLAAPLGTITNVCKMETDSLCTFTAAVDANVCCWAPDIIYVDVNAAGSNTGMSWQDAYIDLQMAHDMAQNCDCNQIWVAAGTYETTVGLALVDGVALYGGFPPGGGTWNDRNPNTHETIISADAYTVVGASNVSQTTIIDGFTIRGGGDRGLWVYNSSPTIRNNKITDNYYGIECEDSYPNIISCVIKDNSEHGIYCCHGGALIKNNFIAGDNKSSSDCGIFLDSLGTAAMIRNNTIVYDVGCGIWLDGGQTENSTISNCIIWAENPLYATDYDVTYSCVQGGYNGDGNINSNPCFMNPADPNDYHLGPNSPCIDAGTNSPIEPNETDIDGEDRIIDGDANDTDIVDMGADEYYWSLADFNRDEVVDFFDYAPFAGAWRTEDPNYSLDGDNDVDVKDLGLFAEDWLWIAGWAQHQWQGQMMGGCGGGFEEPLGLPASAEQLQIPDTPPAEVPDEESDIERMIDWLEQLWLTDEDIRNTYTEDEWLEFIESLKEEL